MVVEVLFEVAEMVEEVAEMVKASLLEVKHDEFDVFWIIFMHVCNMDT